MFAHVVRNPSERTADLPTPRSPCGITSVDQLAEVVLLHAADVVPTQRRSARHETWHCLELDLLGGFRLMTQGQPVALGLSAQRLLAVLACCGRQAPRSQIAHALWPHTTDARSQANLRTVVYRLRRTHPCLVLATKTHLQLQTGIQVDIERTTQLAGRLLSSAADCEAALLEDSLRANLYDDLLPDWDDEWLSDHQYTYRKLRLDALEKLSCQLTTAGRYGAAVQLALAAVQADSLRESAHETLIRAWIAQGNRNEAITHYKMYRRILQDELGLDPAVTLGQLLWSAA